MTKRANAGIASEHSPLWVTMNYLAGGVSLLDMPRLVSSRIFHDETSLRLADVRAAIREVARLVERSPLSAPSVAAFSERLQLEDPASVDIHETRTMAAQELSRLAEGPIVESEQGAQVRRAARYAVAVLSARGHRDVWRSAPREGDFLRRAISSADDERLEDLFLHSARETTPGCLFDRWNRLAGRLEAQEGQDVPEYVNWLGGRDILEQAIMLVDPIDSMTARRRIEAVDRRFHAATLPASGDPLGLARQQWRPRRWWWYRVPADFAP